MILENGVSRTLDPSLPTSRALAIAGDRVAGGVGVHETSLEAKVAQVLIQLRRGEAQITFDPATGSVNVVATSAIGGSGRPDR